LHRYRVHVSVLVGASASIAGDAEAVSGLTAIDAELGVTGGTVMFDTPVANFDTVVKDLGGKYVTAEEAIVEIDMSSDACCCGRCQ